MSKRLHRTSEKMRTDIELLTFGPRKILNTAQQVTQGQARPPNYTYVELVPGNYITTQDLNC